MEGNSLVDQKRKRRLNISRICGIITSFTMVAMLLLFYFKVVDEWILSIYVVFLSAINFIINAIMIKTKDASGMAKANLWLSALFFLIGAGFLAYGLITGNLILF